MKTFAMAAVIGLIPFAAAAHDGMHVVDAYARSANPKAGAAFMVLENHRKVACTLTAVATDRAQKAELHTHQEVEGVMKMGKIEGGITVPAEASHRLQRGGDHVMLMGLNAPLKDGQMVRLTLDFGDCGTEEVEIPVDNQRQPDQAAEDAGMADHGQMDHGAADGDAAHQNH